MKIESIRIENYRMFRSVHIRNLPNMAVFLGANGTGKSTLFDIFSFLQDALVHNVRQAISKRGGFKEVMSRGQEGRILIEIKFRTDNNAPLATYRIEIALQNNLPVVAREILMYRRGQRGQPWRFLDFKYGIGDAITNESDYSPDAEKKREPQKLESPDILAIKGLGQFEKFPVAAEFRKVIENWHVSDFHISDARDTREAGYAEHLSTRGENLPLVAQFLYENHRSEFNKILEKMKKRVPGVSQVEAIETPDGRIVLRFQDGTFKDPFIARYVSDGTIKMFAYLLLLHDPNPHALLAIEEPENQLYPELLEDLAEEFREYSQRGSQVFISTHSYDLVNALDLEEIFWFTKKEGYTSVTRASEDELLRSLVKEGDLPGALWKQRLFKGVGLN